MNRRQLFRVGAGAGALLLLAACGEDDTRAGAGGPPQRGGTLRIGALGKAGKIERDPHQTLSNDSDFLVASLVYDALTVPGADPNVAPRLASKWSSDNELRRWRFELAPAEFHDGSPVTSADVVWSLRRLRDIAGETKVPVASVDDIVADGPNAVVLTTAEPNSQLPLLLRLMTFTVKQGTTDFATGNGTGPFKLESFTNGNARLVRNDDWHGGAPLLDAIEITMFESTDALANAVLGGQIDVASNVGAVAGRSAQGRKELQIIRRPNDIAVAIAMRTSDGPFADQRVREALRLAVDRQAMVEQVHSGYGTVANDILGTGDPVYDTAVAQRSRDVEKAKQLLAQANFDTRAKYQLVTKQEAPGEVESAKVFASQVRDIGVDVEVVVQDSGTFYDKTWLLAPFYTVNWGTNDSVLFFASKVLYSRTKWNETGFSDQEFDDAYRTALAASGDDYDAACRSVQRIEHERGGYIVWGMADGIDIAAPAVRDLPTLPGFGRVQLEKAWLA